MKRMNIFSLSFLVMVVGLSASAPAARSLQSFQSLLVRRRICAGAAQRLVCAGTARLAALQFYDGNQLGGGQGGSYSA